VSQVRAVDEKGNQLGVINTREALQRAEEAGLDLVEVAPNANPPVCRIMDYGKFKYEKSKKTKEAKKKQHVVHLKEIKMRPKTGDHDYHYKMEHARKFLLKGDRVKATIVFRGREITHLEFGEQVLEKLNDDLNDIAALEVTSKKEGRNLISIFVPDKEKIRLYKKEIEKEQKEAEREAKRREATQNTEVEGSET